MILFVIDIMTVYVLGIALSITGLETTSSRNIIGIPSSDLCFFIGFDLLIIICIIFVGLGLKEII